MPRGALITSPKGDPSGFSHPLFSHNPATSERSTVNGRASRSATDDEAVRHPGDPICAAGPILRGGAIESERAETEDWKTTEPEGVGIRMRQWNSFEKIAARMLARHGISVIWELHIRAAASYRRGNWLSALALVGIADAAERLWRGNHMTSNDEPMDGAAREASSSNGKASFGRCSTDWRVRGRNRPSRCKPGSTSRREHPGPDGGLS
jgi:hypothetical protein